MARPSSKGEGRGKRCPFGRQSFPPPPGARRHHRLAAPAPCSLPGGHGVASGCPGDGTFQDSAPFPKYVTQPCHQRCAFGVFFFAVSNSYEIGATELYQRSCEARVFIEAAESLGTVSSTLTKDGIWANAAGCSIQLFKLAPREKVC